MTAGTPAPIDNVDQASMDSFPASDPPGWICSAAMAAEASSADPSSKETNMADDKSKTGQADRDRINVEEDYELRSWAEKFGVTPERLRAAVKTSGPMVKDIEALLGKKV